MPGNTIFALIVVFQEVQLPLAHFWVYSQAPHDGKMAKYLTALCILLLSLTGLTAQNLSTDLLSLLPTLNGADSIRVLGYARHQGAYHGRPLDATCKLLDTTGQRRVADYIRFLQHPGEPEPTTVRFQRDTIPFGTINEGYILLDSFVIVNTGNHPYVISSSKGSCDCTALSLPKYPVMPGDSATIRVEFDSYKKAGKTLAGVIVYDNSRPNRRNILYLEGNVKPKGNVKTIIRD
jgi:hypothetical protein